MSYIFIAILRLTHWFIIWLKDQLYCVGKGIFDNKWVCFLLTVVSGVLLPSYNTTLLVYNLHQNGLHFSFMNGHMLIQVDVIWFLDHSQSMFYLKKSFNILTLYIYQKYEMFFKHNTIKISYTCTTSMENTLSACQFSWRKHRVHMQKQIILCIQYHFKENSVNYSNNEFSTLKYTFR